MAEVDSKSMRKFVDQMGREVLVPRKPIRMISLVPSQTELLYYLGMEEKVVGQTLFCVHPYEQHQIKTKVGGTKKLNMERIHKLNPDLIIGNKEENDEHQIMELMQRYPVWMSDIQSVQDALWMISEIGKLVNEEFKSKQLLEAIQNKMVEIQKMDKHHSCLYLIWKGPWMAAGQDTYISDMLHKVGLSNAIKGKASRYPVIEDEDIVNFSADYIFLSSEPFPFKEKHIQELTMLCPHSKIILVDGEMFSWYGNRLLQSFDYFKTLEADEKFR